MKTSRIFQLLSISIALLACGESMNYGEEKIPSQQSSSLAISSQSMVSSQSSAVISSSSSSIIISNIDLIMDPRVVSYKQEINTTYSDSPRVIVSIDSLKEIFPEALKNLSLNNQCKYIGVSVSRGEGLSYFILTADSLNNNALIINQIIPSLDKKCQYPQTFDWQAFLLCDTSGVLKENMLLKYKVVVDTEMSCTPESHYF